MAEDSRKLFVAGLPDTISEDVLRQLFEATGGSVAEVSLPKDRTTGRPRGFGFVTMATTEAANAARESLHGSFQGGRSISVRPFESAPPKREGGSGPGSSGPRSSAGGPQTESPDRKIYIGNLPYDATPEEVEAVVNATGAGPVVRVIMPSDPDGRKRGFAFAYMASSDAARGAIDLLKGAEVRGRRLVVNHAHDRPAREGGYGGPPSGPRSDFHGPPSGGRDFGGPPRDFGGPPRDFGPPAGGGGPPPGDHRRVGGGPPPQGRKTFDEKRRKTHDDGGGGGRSRRNKNDWNTGKDDWGSDE